MLHAWSLLQTGAHADDDRLRRVRSAAGCQPTHHLHFPPPNRGLTPARRLSCRASPQFKLWRLDFSDVGSHWHAFAGWECTGECVRWVRPADHPTSQLVEVLCAPARHQQVPAALTPCAHAFGHHAEPARKFDQRLSRAAKPWPAPNGSGMQQLGMTAGRTYSAIPRLKTCPPGTNAAAGGGAGARRLQRQQDKRWQPEDLDL